MDSETRSVVADDGVELVYDVLGAGPSLVLLHGGLVGRGAFSRQHEALGAHYRLIVPSARGNDGTDATLPADYGFTTSELRDLLSVLDAEGVERTHILGHSSGGALAFEFARLHPARLDRLVLIEPSLIGLLPEPAQSECRAVLAGFVAAEASGGPMACLRHTFETVAGSAWQALDPETRDARLGRMASMAPIVAPHWQALLEAEVSPADLAEVRDETLLIYAAQATEFFAFEPLIADCWARERPDLKLLRVPDAGHNVHRDQPGVVNDAVLAFLGTAS